MDISQTYIEYLGVEFSSEGMKPASHLTEKLPSLARVDCSKIHNWRSIRGILNQFQRFGPRLTELVTEFREATFDRKKEILNQISTWTIEQGNIA